MERLIWCFYRMSETLDLSTGTATVAKIKRVIEELDEKKKETLKVTRLKVIVATTNCRRLFLFAVGGPSTTHSYDAPMGGERSFRT